MFGNLVDKLSEAFKKFKNKGKLTEADVKAGMKEIKLALLEADVNFKVVKEFINRTTERAVGSEVLESLLPAQQIVKIVNEELISIMGSQNEKLNISPKPPTVIMMVGLQGSGKTTHASKLAYMYKSQSKRPLLAACDVYRPAAIKQLEVMAQAAGVDFFEMGDKENPVTIAKKAFEYAQKHGNDMLFLDTAGRLHVDQELMEELVKIKESLPVTEILLVVDSMTGQDAVNVAKSFNDLLDITGVVLSKMDGDTRGGAALSIRHITGKPIKFIGVGEKIDALEPFYPDRIASRILGMGDMLSLIEKAEKSFDEKKALELERKMRSNEFTLEDYLEQFSQVRSMGSLDQLASMIPGMNTKAFRDVKVDEKQLDRTEAIIRAMTPKERENPDIINPSRKRRIAAGSGVGVEEVNRLLKQFDQTKKLMKQLTGGGRHGRKNKFGFRF